MLSKFMKALNSSRVEIHDINAAFQAEAARAAAERASRPPESLSAETRARLLGAHIEKVTGRRL